MGAAQHRDDGVEGTLNVAGRWRLARAWVQSQHACARVGLAPLGQLHRENPAWTPRDGAAADRCVEDRKVWCRHGEPNPSIRASGGACGILRSNSIDEMTRFGRTDTFRHLKRASEWQEVADVDCRNLALSGQVDAWRAA